MLIDFKQNKDILKYIRHKKGLIDVNGLLPTQRSDLIRKEFYPFEVNIYLHSLLKIYSDVRVKFLLKGSESDINLIIIFSKKIKEQDKEEIINKIKSLIANNNEFEVIFI